MEITSADFHSDCLESVLFSYYIPRGGLRKRRISGKLTKTVFICLNFFAEGMNTRPRFGMMWRDIKDIGNMKNTIEDRVKHYWTLRARDFGSVRRNELENQMSWRWLEEIQNFLPDGKKLDILDVGTGTGFFAVLLAEEGHRVQGVDLTPAMLEEAKQLADERQLDIVFCQMDAQNLEYEDKSFDVVLSRNLSWTLPDPEQAYKEWHRVLRPGGILLNFDANYGDYVRSESLQNASVSSDSPYGHVGMTEELAQENVGITLAMEISREVRPAWDLDVLTRIGFQDVHADQTTGARVLEELDLKMAPMFGIYAQKK